MVDKFRGELTPGPEACFPLVGPTYALIRERLANEFSEAQLTLDTLRYETTVGEANARLARDVVATLPQAKAGRDPASRSKARHDYFDLPDLYQARAVNASVFWEVEELSYGVTPEITAYYLIGSAICGKRAQLLLCPTASRREHGLQTVTVPTKKFQKSEAQFITLLGKDCSEQEVATLFDPDTRGIHIQSPRNSVDNPRRGLWNGGCYLRSALGFQEGQRLSDEDMTKFNVLYYLSGLAVVFFKSTEYEELLEQRRYQLTQTPAQERLSQFGVLEGGGDEPLQQG